MTPEELLALAAEARKKAYAPYSRFAVGAAVWTESGRVWTGCNLENASYGLSVCAERVALWKAVSEGERQIRALAVIADTPSPVTPCGACRQVMAEWLPPGTPVYLGNTSGSWRRVTLQSLLPDAFEMEGWD